MSQSRTLLIDTRQQAGKHILKDQYFEEHNIPTLRTKLPVGDYSVMQDMSVVVDTKKDMQEIVMDICGKQHERFVRELELAKDNGIKLYILIENRGEYVDYKKTIWQKPITSVQDVFSWKNRRAFIMYKGKQKYPKATKGGTLAKAMITMQLKYECEFVFCRPEEAGAKVLELLGVEHD